MGQLYSITFKYVPLFNYIISRNCQHIFCIFTCHAYISHNFPTDLSVISKHRCFFFPVVERGVVLSTIWQTSNQTMHCIHSQQKPLPQMPSLKDTYPHCFEVFLVVKKTQKEGQSCLS